MIHLIIGTKDSGKSKLAEDIAVKLGTNSEKAYIATMLPLDEDACKRIEKHRKQREGKGFITIECPYELNKIIPLISQLHSAVCLLECVSNLVGNEMHKTNKGLIVRDTEKLIKEIVDEIILLEEYSKDLIIVSNEYKLEADYDEETIGYIKLLHDVNEKLREHAHKIYDLTGNNNENN